MNDTSEVTLAVWDMENLHMSARQHYDMKGHTPCLKVQEISEELRRLFRPVRSVMVANWSFLGFYNHQAVLSRSRQVQVAPSNGKFGVNSVDIALVIEVMDQVMSGPEIKRVVLLSGDSDFVPLVAWLQSRQVQVCVFFQQQHVSHAKRAG